MLKRLLPGLPAPAMEGLRGKAQSSHGSRAGEEGNLGLVVTGKQTTAATVLYEQHVHTESLVFLKPPASSESVVEDPAPNASNFLAKTGCRGE